MYDEYLLNSFKELLVKRDLLRKSIICRSRLGKELNLPSDEYALIRGPEVLIECEINGFKGHAFTPYPLSYKSTLSRLVNDLDLGNIGWRGIFFATLNALLTMLGIIDGGTHCKGKEPELCGVELADYLLRSYGSNVSILHIGYHPGHVKALVSRFRNVYVTDLNKDVIGKVKYGVRIIDGFKNNELIKYVDIILITGSAIVNKTIYGIINEVFKEGKVGVIYGVSAKGAYTILKRAFKEFLNIGYFCPYSVAQWPSSRTRKA